MRTIVLAEDFLESNFLSSDLRIPVTLLETNACSPLATNAIRGTFGTTSLRNRIRTCLRSGDHRAPPDYRRATVVRMPAGGVGYTRVPSLVSLWSTAPFLLNNSVGRFNPSPSVKARMESFHDSIEQLLWPEKRIRIRSLETRCRV